MDTIETINAAPRLNHDALLDALMEKLQCKNDRALAGALEVAPPVISKLRHHRLPVGPGLMIRIYDKAAMSIESIRALLAKPLQ